MLFMATGALSNLDLAFFTSSVKLSGGIEIENLWRPDRLDIQFAQSARYLASYVQFVNREIVATEFRRFKLPARKLFRGNSKLLVN